TEKASGLVAKSLTHSLNLSARPALAMGSTRRILTMGPSPCMVQAEVLRREGRLLILELEIPANGMELPEEPIIGLDEEGFEFRLEIVREQSGGAGPFPRGTRVRLALRVSEGHVWSHVSRMTIMTRTRVGGQFTPALILVRFETPT